MLKGEAIKLGKKWQRQLGEGQTLFVDKEQLKQFIDVAVYSLVNSMESEDDK